MKKKILALTLMSVMAATVLAGCGGKGLSNKYINIKQYKGLEVPKVAQEEVTDATVESAVEGRLASTSTKEKVTDRAAKDGDTVNIDYKGSVDGVEFEGGSAEKQDLKLGSGQFIGASGDYKGFEEQIVGHKEGEDFDIEVKFPGDYSNAELSDKVAVFKIKLNEIFTESVPKLTDEWVKENSKKSKTVEEFKKEIRTEMEESSKKSVEASLQNASLNALIEQTEVKEYPKEELDKQLKSINEYYEGMAKSYEMEFKDFIQQQMGLSEEEFKKQAKEAAELTVKRTLACELVAEKNKLEPSEKEYTKEIEKFAEASGQKDVEAFKKQVGEDVLKTTILQQRVGKYLAESCVQVENPKPEDEAKPQDKEKSEDKAKTEDGDKTKDKDSDSEKK